MMCFNCVRLVLKSKSSREILVEETSRRVSFQISLFCSRFVFLPDTVNYLKFAFARLVKLNKKKY